MKKQGSKDSKPFENMKLNVQCEFNFFKKHVPKTYIPV